LQALELGLDGAVKDPKAVGGAGELIKLLLKAIAPFCTPSLTEDIALRDRLTKAKTVLVSSWAKRVNLVQSLLQAMATFQDRLTSPANYSLPLLHTTASTLSNLRKLCYGLCQFDPQSVLPTLLTALHSADDLDDTKMDTSTADPVDTSTTDTASVVHNLAVLDRQDLANFVAQVFAMAPPTSQSGSAQ